MTNNIPMTKEEINADAHLKAINDALEKLISLCKTDPAASIICSICVPSKIKAKEPDEIDVQIISIYAGDTISHIQQFDSLAENEPQFIYDLIMYLDLRIKRQMAKAGTTNNVLADQMLADLDKSKLPN